MLGAHDGTALHDPFHDLLEGQRSGLSRGGEGKYQKQSTAFP